MHRQLLHHLYLAQGIFSVPTSAAVVPQLCTGCVPAACPIPQVKVLTCNARRPPQVFRLISCTLICYHTFLHSSAPSLHREIETRAELQVVYGCSAVEM